MMLRRRQLLLVLLFPLLCCESDRTETFTVKIDGKPVNLVYVFHLSRGSLKWSYEGEVKGKVGVCISWCGNIVEDQYTVSCTKMQMLSGKFDVPIPNYGMEEGIDAGAQRCFVFVPEEGSRGEIRVTFTESRIGGW